MKDTAEDAGWSLRWTIREAAWNAEERFLWRGTDAARTAGERALTGMEPLQRVVQTKLAWPVERAVQTKLAWPVADAWRDGGATVKTGLATAAVAAVAATSAGAAALAGDAGAPPPDEPGRGRGRAGPGLRGRPHDAERRQPRLRPRGGHQGRCARRRPRPGRRAVQAEAGRRTRARRASRQGRSGLRRGVRPLRGGQDRRGDHRRLQRRRREAAGPAPSSRTRRVSPPAPRCPRPRS